MTLLAPRSAPPDRPARSRTPGGPALITVPAVLAVVCAGLLTACSGPSGHPHAASHGARRLPATTSPHPAPTVVHPTTPAPRSSAPRRHRPGGPGAAPSGPAPTGPAPTAPAGPAPSPTGAQPAPLAQCATGALRVSLGTAGGAAGSVYYPLEFTNVSGTPCTMYGYPGVSFVSGPGGAELGGAAVRDPAQGPALVTLAPGAEAHASVQVVVAQNYPKSVCKPVTAHWLRVYPPDQYAPLYTDLTAMTCTGTIPGGSTLGIYVVRAGANGP
jgi:hypothetical protein